MSLLRHQKYLQKNKIKKKKVNVNLFHSYYFFYLTNMKIKTFLIKNQVLQLIECFIKNVLNIFQEMK